MRIMKKKQIAASGAAESLSHRIYGAGMILAIAATAGLAVEMPSICGTQMVMPRA
jgi:hypothetical protein